MYPFIIISLHMFTNQILIIVSQVKALCHSKIPTGVYGTFQSNICFDFLSIAHNFETGDVKINLVCEYNLVHTCKLNGLYRIHYERVEREIISAIFIMNA